MPCHILTSFKFTSTPSGEIGNPVSPASSTNALPEAITPERPYQQSPVTTHSLTMEADETSSGWDDEDSAPFDFNQQADDTTDGWGMTTTLFCFASILSFYI